MLTVVRLCLVLFTIVTLQHQISISITKKYSGVTTASNVCAKHSVHKIGNSKDETTKVEIKSPVAVEKSVYRERRELRSVPSFTLKCKGEYSCRDKCFKPKTYAYSDSLSCYFDNDCEFFQDCCADFKEMCVAASAHPTPNNKTHEKLHNEESVNVSFNVMNKTSFDREMWSCFPFKDIVTGVRGIWMIGSCSKSWPKDDTFYQCRNLSAANTITKDNYQYLPVYTSDGTVYHNRFCAQCNGENFNKTKSYGLILSTSCNNSVVTLNNSDNSTRANCTLEGWRPGHRDPRRYCLKIKKSCNGSADLDTQCNKGNVGIVSNNKCIFKNRFCAECNNASRDLRCGPNITQFSDDCGDLILIETPFQGLHHAMNFENPTTSPSKRLCGPGKVYDEYTKVCRETLTEIGNTTHNCSFVWVALKDGEFVVLINQSVFVNDSKRVYGMTRYIWLNSTLYICEKFSNSYKFTDPKNNELALSLMTMICMSISIVSIVFVLITYSLFTELRTPPGINLMNLSVSILLAQLLWLVGRGQTDIPMACTVIAVLRHYFFLVSFVWTSIIAFDTWKAFTAKGSRSRLPTKRERLLQSMRYMAVGWCSVGVYVAICVILDFTDVIHIGYRSSNGCWMSATLYFFAIPIALIMIFNVILYSLTAKAIYVTRSQARFAAADKDRKTSFGIYARIATVMGFTWIFGFIAQFGWDLLWFAFVFFNSLQGFYIAVAFVFNQRVMKLYKRLLSNNENEVSSGHASQTSRTKGVDNTSMDTTI